MSDNYKREEVFSKSVRAGKRTYFFDVKTTKSQDYYITITESKKRMGDDGNPFFEKHKIFLYREDFEKFLDGLNEAIHQVNNLKPEGMNSENNTGNENHNTDHTTDPNPDQNSSSYSDLNFDDLGK